MSCWQPFDKMTFIVGGIASKIATKTRIYRKQAIKYIPQVYNISFFIFNLYILLFLKMYSPFFDEFTFMYWIKILEY